MTKQRKNYPLRENIKLMWSKFTKVDKFLFWVSIAWGSIGFLALKSQDNFVQSVAGTLFLVSPIIFVWGLLKVVNNRLLMKRLFLISAALFLVGVSVGVATSPEYSESERSASLKSSHQQVEEEGGLNKNLNDANLSLGEVSKESDSTLREGGDKAEPEEADKSKTDAASEDSNILVSNAPPAPSDNGSREKDTVIRVVDGDTIHTTNHKIRIIGLDTPETKDPRKPVQCFGVEATKRMKELADSKVVYLEIDPSQDSRDKYGRSLRNVYLEDGTNVAYEMIKGGYGYEYTYNVPYQRQQDYKDAQNYASSNNLGLWADNTCNGEQRAASASPGDAKVEEGIAEVDNPSPGIRSIKRLSNNQIKISGFGPKRSTVSLALANGDRHIGKTNDRGEFDMTLPSSSSPYGTVTLESVSGAWIFKTHKPLHDTYNYSLFDKEEPIRSKAYAPVITRVSKYGDKYELRGYYLPKSKIMLKANNNVLSKVKTDSRGVFVFDSMMLDKNFQKVEVKTYSGFFSTKEGHTLMSVYVDNENNKTYSELPVTKKIIVKKELIKYETETIDDDARKLNETSVIQEGKNGERTITYQITYRGDKEEKSEILSNEVTLQPTVKRISKGTYVEPPAPVAPKPQPTYNYSSPTPAPSSVYYKNCTAARAAGATPVYAGQPGYGVHLDRDGDGVGCEK